MIYRTLRPSFQPIASRTGAFALWIIAGLLLAGCATSTVLTRKQERAAAYSALSAEDKALVDEGRIRVGMAPDAVYIAWGPPAEVLENETAQGHMTIWVYHGQWVEEQRYWIGRHLESDYYPRSYVRAEIVFQDGVVSSWRTLPKPVM
jgi:hypothetical protein